MIDFISRFQEFIESHFSQKNSINEAIKYILFPGGKYFRPQIFQSLCKDFQVTDEESIFWFSAFLEIHHNYTLIHDDLPCMDDDNFRRGRETIHKKYSPWLAVLAGDALLSLSYECLLKVSNRELSRFSHWALGHKGLILGQVFDLDDSKKQFKDILRVHELKTSRLMQTSLMGAFYLRKESFDFDLYKNIFRLGNIIGLWFQINDDLDDYENGERTKENVFVENESKARLMLDSLENQSSKILEEYSLSSLSSTLKLFIEKSRCGK